MRSRHRKLVCAGLIAGTANTIGFVLVLAAQQPSARAEPAIVGYGDGGPLEGGAYPVQDVSAGDVITGPKDAALPLPMLDLFAAPSIDPAELAYCEATFGN